MAAYEDFASVYDALMDDFDYPGWAAYYLQLLSRKGVHPARMCECACGTGSLTVQFAAMGIAVTGVDVSPRMLEQAQRKARLNGVAAMFVCQDMCALQLPRPVDALVCACDGVNYLLSDRRLNDFFRCAQRALRPGGVLAFDISSPHKLENTLGNGFFGEDREDMAYLWFNRFDPEKRTIAMNLTFFVREEGERFRRFCETHIQKAHEPEALVCLLERNGFVDISICGDRNFDPPAPNEARIHIAAVRE